MFTYNIVRIVSVENTLPGRTSTAFEVNTLQNNIFQLLKDV